MSDDEEFCFRPARRTAEQKKQDAQARQSAPPQQTRARPESFGGGNGEGREEDKQRAMDAYTQLNEGIILSCDDADAFFHTIRAHQREAGESDAPSCVMYGFDLSIWPPNKPILICAAEYGRTEIVRLLIKDFCCNVNVRRSKDQNTAVHCAAYYGHSETVRALVELGADCSLVNKFGEKPVQAATQGKQNWDAGQHKQKRAEQDPFHACFRSMGLEPAHNECAAQL
mmetsp:Transcript_24769/g.48173  ORF Transcript_24769/g.48173 Transcript_24769/m.48173 type:complete len:227 (+) Transcript_24769:280-960(+)|eukprot:CAMPEP_0173380904 /NCGR_PEP_ID=MMETSP1356-20130122/3467_1 /TAXON_ID=77927 ORGANISM="Hemiselmis virescens, Strain PCC157" /NCGR_SAMPLE_ID=MMETSP1356 /ASSEMBLY_ACC=CAM_ASM_000847 /LENGTH=226 /DNA_ID=CAMNT_0014334619 /DNA_START=275 /DNA_END=955 /DNA_ORIENTATION=-